MGNELKCRYCEDNATVHLNLIMNGKSHKVHLCQKCAEQKGVTDPKAFSLAESLLPEAEIKPAPLENVEKDISITCEVCGFSYSKFRKSGRLGCAACYQAFEKRLVPLIKGMHKAPFHKGKIPHRSMERRAVKERMEILNGKLRSAVTEERYEDAARYRDQLNQLRLELELSPTTS